MARSSHWGTFCGTYDIRRLSWVPLLSQANTKSHSLNLKQISILGLNWNYLLKKLNVWVHLHSWWTNTKKVKLDALHACNFHSLISKQYVIFVIKPCDDNSVTSPEFFSLINLKWWILAVFIWPYSCRQFLQSLHVQDFHRKFIIIWNATLNQQFIRFSILTLIPVSQVIFYILYPIKLDNQFIYIYHPLPNHSVYNVMNAQTISLFFEVEGGVRI